MPGPLDGYGLEEDMSNRSINADDDDDKLNKDKKDGIANLVSVDDAGQVNIPQNPEQADLVQNLKDFSNPSTLYSSNVTTPIKQAALNALGGNAQKTQAGQLTQAIREAALKKIGYKEPQQSQEDMMTHKGEILGFPEKDVRNKILDTAIDYGTDPLIYTPVLGAKLEEGLGEAGVDALSEMKGGGHGIESAANTSSYIPDAIDSIDDYSNTMKEPNQNKNVKQGALAALTGMAKGGIVKEQQSPMQDRGLANLNSDTMNEIHDPNLSTGDHFKLAVQHAAEASDKIQKAKNLNQYFNANNPISRALENQAHMHNQLAKAHTAKAINKVGQR